MIKFNNQERVIEEIKEEKVENVFNIIPNVSDKILDYIENEVKICDLIDNTFDDKRKYESQIRPSLLLLAGIQSRMKQQFSISEVPLALTSKNVIEKINLNISYNTNDTILKESNIRAILDKYNENNKDIINFNNYFINYTNELTEKIMNKLGICPTIHILDCSILDVNIDNANYEGSTIAHKGGEKLRGYKIGALRGITSNGGIIEEICMSTAKTHDLEMSKEMIMNSKYLKPGDYFMEDRGFIDLEMFRFLVEKEINVILPVKRNMEIYQEAVNNAKLNNQWIKHPNSKRKGQEITIVSGLERTWLTDNEKNKKPKNIKLGYKINACVIRLDKEKNKNILTDEEIISTDDKYAYVCIITNDTTLSCSEIIRMYEMRPEIEEDFRQLKDFWGLNIYRSTQYNIISFIIMLSILGYNFWCIYKESEEGKEYIGKSLIVEERHGLYIVKGVRTAIVTTHYFYIFNQDELLDLYASLDKQKRALIKQYLRL